jgi:hypothetical protein
MLDEALVSSYSTPVLHPDTTDSLYVATNFYDMRYTIS